MIKSAIILAGGLGTRLRSAVPDLPKPMAPVNGKPFLASLMDYWISQGVEHFVLSVGYRYQTIIDYFGHTFNGADIDYVIETTPLGTGGGLLLANQSLSSTKSYFLLNGDTFCAVDAQSLCDYANKVNSDWCFSLFKSSDSLRYLGLEIGMQGEIISLHSKNQSGERVANGGVYLVNPRSLIAFEAFIGKRVSLEEEIFPKLLLQKQKLFGMTFDKKFIDIGVPEDYQRAADLIAY